MSISFENFEIIDNDAWEIKKDLINEFQKLSGRTLTESSPETLIFNTVAYVLALYSEKLNDEIKQNYLRFARGERLDLKGDIYGSRGARIDKQPAVATFRFYISSTQATDVIIPRGTRIKYNNLYFETNEQYKIIKGNLYTDGIATCTTTGTVGNNIPIGQIKELVDLYNYYSKVENITITNGGTDTEEDDTYRDRIRQIPESFTTAGSRGAYEFWVKTTSPLITDVSIYSPSPCNVHIYLWTETGKPTDELKKRVLETVNSDARRPLTDNVEIKDLDEINYNIDIDYYINKDDEILLNQIKSNIEKSINEYTKWQENKIGRDINSDELIKLLKLAGVKRVVLREPTFKKLEFNQIAKLNTKTINYKGVEEI